MVVSTEALRRALSSCYGSFVRILHIHAASQPTRTHVSDQAAADQKCSGRKLVITPDGMIGRSRPKVDSALARARRWQRTLESGECDSIAELAAAERTDRSYLCRVLRLTLLAPEIVEAILDVRQSKGWGV